MQMAIVSSVKPLEPEKAERLQTRIAAALGLPVECVYVAPAGTSVQIVDVPGCTEEAGDGKSADSV